MRPQNILLPLFLLFIAAPLMAQVPKNNLDVHHPPSRPSVASSMETKSDHCFHSVLENDRVRVFKVEVPALQSTSVNYHRHDYLVVSLGKSNFEIAGSGIRYPMQMEDGEMQVIKGGASHRITNLSDTPLQLVEMEVMREITRSVPYVAWVDAHVVTESSAEMKTAATAKAHYSKPIPLNLLAFSSVLAVCFPNTATTVAMSWSLSPTLPCWTLPLTPTAVSCTLRRATLHGTPSALRIP